jgi:hypothetical protein
LTSASLSVNRVNHFGSEKLSDSCSQIHLVEEWKGFSWPLRLFEDGKWRFDDQWTGCQMRCVAQFSTGQKMMLDLVIADQAIVRLDFLSPNGRRSHDDRIRALSLAVFGSRSRALIRTTSSGAPSLTVWPKSVRHQFTLQTHSGRMRSRINF